MSAKTLKLKTDNRIKIVAVIKDEAIKETLSMLNPNLFSVINLDNVEDALSYKSINFIIIIEENCLNEGKIKTHEDHRPVIIVTERDFNLKEDVSLIPKEMIKTNYLEEFIYWSVYKANLSYKKQNVKHKRERAEEIINNLHEISRSSIFNNMER